MADLQKRGSQFRADSNVGGVTLADIAERAGVSQSTVSRVIRRPHLVQKSTAARVRRIMQEVGYVVPRVEGTSVPMTIGVSLPDVSDPFFTVLLKGILDATSYGSLATSLQDAGNSAHIQLAGIERLISAGVGALIVVPVSAEESFAARIESYAVPVIYVDRVPEKEPVFSVVCDDHEGALQATHYLLSMGHRSIAYIGGDTDLSTERSRLQGYRDALEAAGIEPDPDLIHELSFDQEKILHLDSGACLAGRSFTAVFAANDNLAVTVQRWLETQGRRAPDDVSIMGYNDMPFSRHLGLSSVSSPAYEMGKNAVLLTLAVLEERVPEGHRIVLKPRVLVRSSCAPPRSEKSDEEAALELPASAPGP